MAKTQINISQLKNFMKKQLEELEQINELKKALNKTDKDVPECMDYLNRMNSACQQVISMCDEYNELEKAKVKEEADKIKAEAKKIKADEAKETKEKVVKEKIAEPVEDEDDDDIWN